VKKTDALGGEIILRERARRGDPGRGTTMSINGRFRKTRERGAGGRIRGEQGSGLMRALDWKAGDQRYIQGNISIEEQLYQR